MKKEILLISLALCAAALAGCRVTAPPLEDAPEAASSAVAASEAAADPATQDTTDPGKVIEPLPATLNLSALDDCTFAAGFPASAIATDANGAASIALTVYDCDKFDLLDISQLAPGDTIVVEGATIAVSTVERNGNLVTINGGIEQGGCDLTTAEDGVYYPTIWDAAPVYHALGEVTLPMSEAFVYTDRTDLEKPEQQYNADDFLAAMKDSGTEFTPQATTVSVAGGQITEVTRNYTP